MNRFTYDLHVHSCLSPCADNDNTPNNLAGMATLNHIEIMALTDHNTTKNCPAFFEAAKRYGIIPVPGMELTTA
ncbi:MAG: PHP domain-containing protein, partial [Lachnospiraceae bacterium]|nr:PHP domain-containing protein [Lachnospiraceae bacterium]